MKHLFYTFILFSFSAMGQTYEFFGFDLDGDDVLCICQELRSTFHKFSPADRTIVEELCKVYDYQSDPIKAEELKSILLNKSILEHINEDKNETIDMDENEDLMDELKDSFHRYLEKVPHLKTKNSDPAVRDRIQELLDQCLS